MAGVIRQALGNGGGGGPGSTGGGRFGRKTTSWVDDGEDGAGSPSTPAVAPRRLGIGGSAGGASSSAPKGVLRSGGSVGAGSGLGASGGGGGGGGGGMGFCAECGAPYTRPGQKFCMECGTPA